MLMWEPVIGLEVHVELLTKSKLFCGCANRFGAPPNSQVCPVCLALPGALPALNARAVDLLITAGLATHCDIPPRSKFDRKNYFYPDMPKNFQISQYDLPVAVGGWLDIPGGRRIRITRIHLEEDTGKSTHPASLTDGGEMVAGRIDSAEYTLEDYNRAGVPLAEIVSEPDVRGADEAVAYLQQLREILVWAGVSDCKMEEGSLRCDANVSVRPTGQERLGTRTEIKNLNSFKSVQKAISHEIQRQIKWLEGGGKIVQETRAWDEQREVTHSLRSKEEAHDYRYFPEPDLRPLEIDAAWLERIRKGLPEMPAARRARFESQYSLPAGDADGLTRTREMADFFEAAVTAGAPAKEAANWLLGDVSRMANERGGLEHVPLSPARLCGLISLIEKGTITRKIAKEVLDEMVAGGKDADAIVEVRGLRQIDSSDALRPILEQVLDKNADAVASFLGGREKAFDALVGQVMAATRGKANPAVAREMLREMIAARN